MKRNDAKRLKAAYRSRASQPHVRELSVRQHHFTEGTPMDQHTAASCPARHAAVVAHTESIRQVFFPCDPASNLGQRFVSLRLQLRKHPIWHGVHRRLGKRSRPRSYHHHPPARRSIYSSLPTGHRQTCHAEEWTSPI